MTKKNVVRIDELAGADAGMSHHPMYGPGNGFAPQPAHPSAPPPPLQPLAHPFEGPTMTHSCARPAAKRRSPDTNAVVPPTPVKSRKTSAAQASPSQQNPYSTSRGLRHFSMKVCEKVEERGTTTYNEVADEVSARRPAPPRCDIRRTCIAVPVGQSVASSHAPFSSSAN